MEHTPLLAARYASATLIFMRAGRIIYYIPAIYFRDLVIPIIYSGEREDKTVEMNKQGVLIVFLISVFILSVGARLPGQTPEAEIPETCQVCIKNSCFSVELAETQSQRQYGLMNREDLDPEKGMLFVFEKEGNYSFWMKNTLIPLDIIWINSSREIVHIERNAQPCTSDYCPSFDPGKNASYVLEINGGLSEKYGINTGDKANISYLSSSNSRDILLSKKRAVIHPMFLKFNRPLNMFGCMIISCS